MPNTVTDSVARLLLNMPHGFEISGRLFWQARELLGANFFLLGKDQKKHDAFANALLDTMLKCHAMEYHMANFKKKENRFLESIEAGEDGIYRSHEMLFEFEAFLFQMKSALDIGVKIIGILLPGRFGVQTFGDKGEKLRRGLNQYGRDRSAKQDLVKALQELLADDREAWLEQAINLRDEIGHYRTFADFNYHAVNHGGARTIRKPTLCGMQPAEYMELVYKNCLEFLQDFICLSIGLVLPGSFTVGVRSDGPCSVGEPLASYIKFGLARGEEELSDSFDVGI